MLRPFIEWILEVSGAAGHAFLAHLHFYASSDG